MNGSFRETLENPAPTTIRNALRSREGRSSAYTRRGDEGPPRGRRTLTGREASQEDYRKQIISVEILLANSLGTLSRSNVFGPNLLSGSQPRTMRFARDFPLDVFHDTVRSLSVAFVRFASQLASKRSLRRSSSAKGLRVVVFHRFSPRLLSLLYANTDDSEPRMQLNWLTVGAASPRAYYESFDKTVLREEIRAD